MGFLNNFVLPDVNTSKISDKQLKEMKNTLDVFNEGGYRKKSNNITDWGVNRSVVIRSLFYMYLFKKYKRGCIIIAKGAPYTDIALIISLNDFDKNIDKNTYFYLNSYLEQVKKCLRKNSLVVCPVRIKISDVSVHANLLIFRKTHKTIEVFEPHGSHFYGGDQNISAKIFSAYSTLSSIFNKDKIIDNQYTLHQSDVVCPSVGFQAIEEMSLLTRSNNEGYGYCSVWSMFITELLLMNPELTTSQVINTALKITSNTVGNHHKLSDYLRSLIRGYTTYITRQIEKYFTLIFGESRMESIRIGEKKPSTKEKNEAYTLFSTFIFIQNYLDMKPKETPISMLSKLKTGIFKNKLSPINLNYAEHILNSMISKDYGIFSEPGRHSQKLIESIIYKKRCPNGTKRDLKGICVKQKIQTKKNNTIKKVIKPCPLGKVRHPDTGRCRKIQTKKFIPIKKVIKPCPPGKVRHPDTKRCRKIQPNKTNRMICPAGCIVNPELN